MTASDGGPAFPMSDLSAYGIGPEYPACGMSLRDYFAAQALVGLLAHPDPINARTAGEAALCAYELANAMLAEKRCRESAE